MINIGEIFNFNNKSWIVAESHLKSVSVFSCEILENGEIVINYDDPTEFELENLEFNNCEVLKVADLKLIEQIKRNKIFDRVKEFYQLFHQKPEFQPESSNLSYAGKVYDEKEMIALADASLDFWLTSGRFCNDFEKKFAEYLGVKYVLLTNSGSSANLLAISALTSVKLGERRLVSGDEVITVAAGFPTTVAPIVQNNLVPVFVDVDLATYNISIKEIEDAISPRTKAIMIAHTMGNPFDLSAILELTEKYNLWLIEDNCDALGSRYNGQLTGTFGHIATSSFYPPHHMTMGEGGAVYTNDPKLKMIVESFRDWGRDCWCPSGCDNTCRKRFGWQLGQLPVGYDHKYTYSHLGYNLKVTDMQAAIGLEQLKKVPFFSNQRIHNFNRLKDNLQIIKDILILPEATLNSEPSWFGFILTVIDGTKFSRNKITQYLETQRVQTRMLFSGNLTKQPAFEGVYYKQIGTLPNTDKIMFDTFLVGVYPGLDDSMIDYMSKKIIEAVEFARNK
ncbi:lipopolysaccharide biosynthesis protein RfbH [Paenibacillus sp. PsM32]|uniref:lipopolysaccharide biosynthesis protein RfbH n=1 Tax=Paenibacillus sp. PsM32 TaxID=3030536 RepID=UPI00263A6410|nr:lipopolysaccharide biosynthesis protein RfbH [Paenibacillus sp. PsM32]MDN4620957.1 lipopolysaccharide biosynthesis protein RfbH [Paenibacillus sp. PsM32]